MLPLYATRPHQKLFVIVSNAMALDHSNHLHEDVANYYKYIVEM